MANRHTNKRAPKFAKRHSKDAYLMLGRVTFYLADTYPFIRSDVHGKTPERRACEIIIALKVLIEYTQL